MMSAYWKRDAPPSSRRRDISLFVKRIRYLFIRGKRPRRLFIRGAYASRLLRVFDVDMRAALKDGQGTGTVQRGTAIFRDIIRLQSELAYLYPCVNFNRAPLRRRFGPYRDASPARVRLALAP